MSRILSRSEGSAAAAPVMVPLIDGRVHHFGPRGLYNGLILLGDDETGSYWDHITGECVYGPLKATQMEMLPVEHTTVG
ncbi:MAG: DUF3179 domain-containing (seleno)protein, partial [Thermaerobacterales bacterium]